MTIINKRSRIDLSTLFNCGYCFILATLLSSFAAVPGLRAQTPYDPPSSAPNQNSIVGAPYNLQDIPIAAGDLLHVDVFHTPELSGDFRVDQHGDLALPLGLTVNLLGLTLEQAADAISAELRSSKMMLHPSVIVSVLQYASAGITILGEVKRPGVYTLLGPHTLYDALAAAGGPTNLEGPDIRISHLDHPDQPVIVPVSGPDFSKKIRETTVLPGDTIVVSQADVIYIVGDVNHSGSFPIPIRRPITVLEALSLANGVDRTAATSRAAIVRESPDGQVLRIPVDLDKVMKTKETDIALQAGDVLVVPRSGLKTFEVAALPALASGAINAAVDEILLH